MTNTGDTIQLFLARPSRQPVLSSKPARPGAWVSSRRSITLHLIAAAGPYFTDSYIAVWLCVWVVVLHSTCVRVAMGHACTFKEQAAILMRIWSLVFTGAPASVQTIAEASGVNRELQLHNIGGRQQCSSESVCHSAHAAYTP
jgi:hypothetical protein